MKDIQTHFHCIEWKISEKDIIKYIFQQFEDVRKSNKIKDLVAFHTSNKYMIMAHDQTELKKLGNIVASYKKIPFSDMLQDYENHLKIAMVKKPTTKTHTNVIMHIFGYFSKQINQNEKELFYYILQQFKENKITIGKTLLEISHIAFRCDNTYLASQTYYLLYSDLQPEMLFDKLDKKRR